MIEVTWIETGVTRKMFSKEFFELFGEAEGLEILDGHLPEVVAVEMAA